MSRLDKIDRVLGYLQTIVAVISLLCLIIGAVFYAQANSYMAQAYSRVSQIPETSTVTVTVIASTATITTTNSSSTCTVHPCNYTEVVTMGLTFSASASANVTRVKMVQEAQALLRAAQEASDAKMQFDNAGTVLLVLFLFLTSIKWIAQKKRHDRTRPGRAPNIS